MCRIFAFFHFLLPPYPFPLFFYIFAFPLLSYGNIYFFVYIRIGTKLEHYSIGEESGPTDNMPYR